MSGMMKPQGWFCQLFYIDVKLSFQNELNDETQGLFYIDVKLSFQNEWNDETTRMVLSVVLHRCKVKLPE